MRLSKHEGSMACRRRSVLIRAASSRQRSSIYGLMRMASRSIQPPGKPTDNAYAESFNATVRLECLGRYWFLDLDDVCQKVEEWRTEYNEVRPHSAIGDRTPLSLIHLPRQQAEALNRPEILT